MKNITKKLMTVLIVMALFVLSMLAYHVGDCGYWRRRTEAKMEKLVPGHTFVADCIEPIGWNEGLCEWTEYDENGNEVGRGGCFWEASDVFEED